MKEVIGFMNRNEYKKWVQWTNEQIMFLDGKSNREKMNDICIHLVSGLCVLVRPLLKEKPYYKDRVVIFERLTKSHQIFGECHIMELNEILPARIRISQYILFPGNGEVIVNTVLHELIHALLPWGEKHKKNFQDAAACLNGSFGCVIEDIVDFKEGQNQIIPVHKEWYEIG